MRRPGLKTVRVAVAMFFGTGLTAAFVDFRGAVPAQIGHWLASVQLVPSAVALVMGESLAVLVAIFAATLLAGRIYCSTVCPLGILQDVAARLAGWFRRAPLRLPYRPARNWVRIAFFWVSVTGIAYGFAGLTLSLVDPYSIFGRMAADLFRPIVAFVNNAIVGVIRGLGGEGLYRVDLHWASAGALALPAIILLLVVGLAAWRGRLYCNTFCPVGTLLGFISKRSAWQLSLDPALCRKCGDCLRVCKAQCIDLRAGKIDQSRCVSCYNCIGACEEHGIHHRWSWRRQPSRPAGTADLVADPQRRSFLAGATMAITGSVAAVQLRAGSIGSEVGNADGSVPSASLGRNESPAISPPGSVSVDQFLDRCTGCHLCISACPTQVLQPAFLEYGFAGFLKPRLDFSTAFCNYDCRRCAEACPDTAITLLPLLEKQTTRIGVAHLDLEHCIVKTKGTDCAACSEHCPTKAVDTVPYGNNLRLPQVSRESCIGCGACEYACPAKPRKAIVVVGQRRHSHASRRLEEKAVDPRKGKDFPF